VRRKDDFCTFIDRQGDRLTAAMRRRLGRFDSRLHALLARPGFAGHRGRVAMRGRHVAELTSALRQRMNTATLRRARRVELLGRGLAQFDPRHRLAAVRTRLVTRDGQLGHAATRRLHQSDGRFRALAARLEGLSPLSVLARGYAVAWDASRTHILRDPASVSPGDEIIVTLERGELRSIVKAQGDRHVEGDHDRRND
jgi:exodeoxyribonuclease VII large subunit